MLLRNSPATLRWAILFFMLANVADLATTQYCTSYVASCFESNPIMRDSITHEFLFFKGLYVKAIGAFFGLVPLSFFFKKIFDSWVMAASPWAYYGFFIWQAAVQNMYNILFH